MVSCQSDHTLLRTQRQTVPGSARLGRPLTPPYPPAAAQSSTNPPWQQAGGQPYLHGLLGLHLHSRRERGEGPPWWPFAGCALHTSFASLWTFSPFTMRSSTAAGSSSLWRGKVLFPAQATVPTLKRNLTPSSPAHLHCLQHRGA
jgi:hypothetical protein